MIKKSNIIKKLKEVIDPELGINIVDMGLVYKIEEKKRKDNKQQFYIEMTYTTPMCPLMGFIEGEIKRKLEELDADFDIKVVFNPPWTPEKMSKSARKKLGI